MATPQLNIQDITNQIDECLRNHEEERRTKQELSSKLRCRRGVHKDMDTIQQFSSSTTTKPGGASATALAADHPLHFFILFEENMSEEEVNDDGDYNRKSILKGVAMWYFGYSTWQGKVMNIDTLLISNDGSIDEKMVLDVLVKISKYFGLRRIVHQIQGTKEAELFKEKYNADLLGEWLTLKMGRNEMTSFLMTRGTWDPDFSSSQYTNNATDISTSAKSKLNICGEENIFNSIDINCVIDTILSKINPSVKKRKCASSDSRPLQLQLQRAKESDAKSILNLVHGLALYEKALHEVHVDEKIYQLDGGGNHPMYHCILLKGIEVTKGDIESENGAVSVVGMGFFYFGRSPDGRRFLYLEDLFIEKEYRGNGFGKAIMYSLAEIAQDLNCESFVWQALDWNTPALKFYESIGAAVCDGLITLRFDKERIDGYQFTEVDED